MTGINKLDLRTSARSSSLNSLCDILVRIFISSASWIG